jgi:hypothetical protein
MQEYPRGRSCRYLSPDDATMPAVYHRRAPARSLLIGSADVLSSPRSGDPLPGCMELS